MGEAKRRGTFEQRRAEALAAGRGKVPLMEVTEISVTDRIKAETEGVIPRAILMKPCSDCGGSMQQITCQEVADFFKDKNSCYETGTPRHWHRQCGRCAAIFDTVY